VDPASPVWFTKNNTRDDLLGGIPKTAVAGLFLIFTFRMEIIAAAQILSVQN